MWEHELPTDLTGSFAAYSPQSGDYLFFVKDESFYRKPKTPTGFEVVKEPTLSWTCTSKWCESSQDYVSCCAPLLQEDGFDNGGYLTPEACVENSDCSSPCCSAYGAVDCCYCPGWGLDWYINSDCECSKSSSTCSGLGSFETEHACNEHLSNLPEENECHKKALELKYAWELNSCNCIRVTPDLPTEKVYEYFYTEDDCLARVNKEAYCSDTYNTDPEIPCLCEKAAEGTVGEFSDYYTCRKSLHGNPDCRPHQESDCECVESDSWGYFHTKASCIEYLGTDPECGKYELVDCDCVQTETGDLTWNECESSKGSTTYYYCSTLGGWDSYTGCDNFPQDYRYACSSEDGSCSSCPELVWEIANCECTTILSDEALGTTYETESTCQQALTSEPACVLYSLNTTTCSCELVVSQMNPDGVSTFADLSSCEAARDEHLQCQKYSIQDCQCVGDSSGSFTGLINCQTALSSDSQCAPHWLVNCNCTMTDPADGTPSFPDLTACIEALDSSIECNCDSTDRRYNTFEDTGDTFCLDAGPGSGAFTECECMELGYTII